jgi:capsular polysaccharide transport system permease protein
MGKQEKAPYPAETEVKGEIQQRATPPATQPRPSTPAPVTNPIADWAADTLRLDFAKAAQRRRRSFLINMAIFIGLPTLIAAAYVYLFATPRYVSEIQVVYQSYNQAQTQTQMPSVLSSFLGSSSGGLDMTRVISSYVASDTLLGDLDKKLNMRAHYSNPKIDFLDRLGSNASNEDFLNYFKNRVSVNVMMGGYDVIDVQAFDPKTAAGIAQAMADDIDQMVENLTERERNDEMTFAQSELTRTENALLQAKLRTTEFRNTHREFDPLASAEQLQTTVVGGLEGQVSQYRATLASRRLVLGEDSPTVKSLEAEIAALEQQISDERTRLATSAGSSASGAKAGGGEPYSELVGQFTTLTQNETFAVDDYQAAKQAFELARADAARKENYVECFVKANVPQRATSPDPLMTILATFAVAVMAYSAGSLLIASFRDQAGV